MAAPDSMQRASELIETIHDGLQRGENWAVHCRGGVQPICASHNHLASA
jgi:protein-tyrosine phosphatase